MRDLTYLNSTSATQDFQPQLESLSPCSAEFLIIVVEWYTHNNNDCEWIRPSTARTVGWTLLATRTVECGAGVDTQGSLSSVSALTLVLLMLKVGVAHPAHPGSPHSDNIKCLRKFYSLSSVRLLMIAAAKNGQIEGLQGHHCQSLVSHPLIPI